MRTRVYRALLWLYPSRFRREYRAPMVQLYADLERSGARPFRRAFAELAITVPYQYWEAFMCTSLAARSVVLLVVTTAAVLASIVVGAGIIGSLLMLLLVWELYAIMRTRGWNANVSWWHFLLAGVGVEVALMAVYALPDSLRPDLPFGYFLTLGLIMVGLVLVTLGFVLAMAGLVRRLRHTT